MQCYRGKSWIIACSLALLSAAGCTAPIKPPPLPPSASASSAHSATPASYTLPDGTKVHDVKCSCCQH
jgi:cytochrome c5